MKSNPDWQPLCLFEQIQFWNYWYIKFSSTLKKKIKTNQKAVCENADKPLSEVLPSDGDIIRSQSKVQSVGGAACQ